MLGNADAASRCVEDTLTEVKCYRQEIPMTYRDATTLAPNLSLFLRNPERRAAIWRGRSPYVQTRIQPQAPKEARLG
jgi:hypothetical protein